MSGWRPSCIWRTSDSIRSARSARGPKASAVTDAARSAGVDVETVVLDVTHAKRCRERRRACAPRALVNNAGYSGVGAIEDVTDEDVRRQLETMASCRCVSVGWRSRSCVPRAKDASSTSLRSTG